MMVQFTEMANTQEGKIWGKNSEVNFVIQFDMCCPINRCLVRSWIHGKQQHL
jgi:hypothetical protein